MDVLDAKASSYLHATVYLVTPNSEAASSGRHGSTIVFAYSRPHIRLSCAS